MTVGTLPPEAESAVRPNSTLYPGGAYDGGQSFGSTEFDRAFLDRVGVDPESIGGAAPEHVIHAVGATVTDKVADRSFAIGVARVPGMGIEFSLTDSLRSAIGHAARERDYTGARAGDYSHIGIAYDQRTIAMFDTQRRLDEERLRGEMSQDDDEDDEDTDKS